MHRRDALLTMLSTAVFAGIGCSGGTGKRRVAVVPKGTSHDFWNSVHYGADQAGTEASVEVLWNGTSDEKDSTGQRKIVDTLIGRQVDGICLAPISKTTGGQIIQSAKRQSIPTVVFDSGVEDTTDIVSYVATDNYKGGRMAGERLAKVMGGEGGVIMLRYQVGSESTEQREKGFLDVIADTKKYPNIKILSDSEHIDSSVDKAQKAAESLLGRFGNEIKGVFTVCEPNNKGMYRALQQYVNNEDNKAKPGDIKFVGFDSDPRMIEGLQNGMVHGLVLQNPVNMGSLAVKTMVAHLDGKTVEKRISTGEEIALPEHLKKDHKDYAKFQELLKPKQL